MSDNTENLTVTVPATSEPPQEVREELLMEKSSLVWRIFVAFVNGTEMEVTEEELRDYAVEDLKINLSQLPSIFIENLPLILVAFMNMWSGWLYKGEYFAGTSKRLLYFNRFHKHMIHKANMLGNSDFVASILKSICFKESHSYIPGLRTNGNNVQPRISGTDKEFSPYAISIQCPASLMNTIVFSNVQEDIIMKQHTGIIWQNLSTIQLLNWPNVEVVFRTPDLCFVRRQATHYLRYLNSLPFDCKRTSINNIIERIERLNTYGRATMCYTYRLLKEYVREYVCALTTVKNINGSKLEEIHSILGQFLEDVRHINMNNSMATDTIVLFRLSRLPFVRNKKLVKNSEEDNEEVRIGYCEVITPKIELLLVYFRAIQKQTPHVSFEYTDRIKENAAEGTRSLLPYILYKCTFCKVDFSGPCGKEQMLNHFKTDHKMEQHVRCAVCRKQFDLLSLTKCRWAHRCNGFLNIDLERSLKITK